MLFDLRFELFPIFWTKLNFHFWTKLNFPKGNNVTVLLRHLVFKEVSVGPNLSLSYSNYV